MLEYDKHESEEKIVIKLFGEVDMFNAGEFKKIFSPNDSREIIVDCENLDYIDSTGLGALVSVLKKAKEFGGTVRIIGLKPQIYKLFELTELDSIFDIEVGK